MNNPFDYRINTRRNDQRAVLLKKYSRDGVWYCTILLPDGRKQRFVPLLDPLKETGQYVVARFQYGLWQVE